VLFAAGEQGVWYDPSDFSTLFQDAAGTTPVTAVEQAVRLMLDKSGRGNHATAPSDTARPVLRARYNLLTYSEQFNDAAWTPNAATVTTNSTVAPDGTTTADTLTPLGLAGSIPRVAQLSTATVTGAGYTASIYAKAGTWTFLQIYIANQSSEWVNFTLTGSGSASTNGSCTATIEALPSGWYRCEMRYTAGGTDRVPFFMLAPSGSATRGQNWNPAGTETMFIWGADLRVTNDALNQPAYQRVGAATDYDTNGFLPYLACDGSDDAMSTSAIDFSGTDKMTVFAGVRKLSDAAQAVIVELSADINSNNGTFRLLSTDGTTLSYQFANKGTTRRDADTSGYAAPITNVVTGIGDISGDVSIIRLNGAQIDSNTADQGSGNYGNNYKLFIGARNDGASQRLTGRIYSLIVRGAASSAAEIAATEAYINARTGAY